MNTEEHRATTVTKRLTKPKDTDEHGIEQERTEKTVTERCAEKFARLVKILRGSGPDAGGKF